MLLLVEQQCVLCGHNDALHIFGSGTFYCGYAIIIQAVWCEKSWAEVQADIFFVLSVGDVRR